MRTGGLQPADLDAALARFFGIVVVKFLDRRRVVSAPLLKDDEGEHDDVDVKVAWPYVQAPLAFTAEETFWDQFFHEACDFYT